MAKVIELTAESSESFEDAIRQGIAKAGESLRNVRAAWIKEQQVTIADGEIASFRVDLKITFLVE
ncbi:MAG TPA: dodecin family protein [Gaiellaceae bacterium]|nr:dodecin family protein [Gaiellaceae bacterium]